MSWLVRPICLNLWFMSSVKPTGVEFEVCTYCLEYFSPPYSSSFPRFSTRHPKINVLMRATAVLVESDCFSDDGGTALPSAGWHSAHVAHGRAIRRRWQPPPVQRGIGIPLWRCLEPVMSNTERCALNFTLLQACLPAQNQLSEPPPIGGFPFTAVGKQHLSLPSALCRG